MENNSGERQDSDSEQLEGIDKICQLLSLPDTNICDVWASNFEEEMTKLMKLTQRFNVIAMDTEFPGIFVRRADNQSYREEQAQYYLIRNNVQATKLIQIGLTIADSQGNVPYPVCTWQFNFKFDIQKENIVDQSADLLKKAGVQFQRLKHQGIDYLDFAQYLQASGFVYNPEVKWVVFHGSSDFAYLLRLVRNSELPTTIDEFYHELKKYYPNIYDLKYVIKDIPSLKDVGLAKLSYQIGCNRIGPQHQAGSDSLLTLCCFFKMQEQHQYFTPSKFDESLNVIFGIGKGYIKNNLNGYQREYQTSPQPGNHYGSQYYDDRYYQPDNRMYMQQNYQMYPGGHGHGALYTYMHHHHTNNYMMYQPHDQNRRY